MGQKKAFVIFKCALVGEWGGMLTYTMAKWKPDSISIGIMSAIFIWISVSPTAAHIVNYHLFAT